MFSVTLPTSIEQLPWWTYTADNPSCTPEFNDDDDGDDDNFADDDDDDKNCCKDQNSTYILWGDAMNLLCFLTVNKQVRVFW